jgi:hypothetical protein
VSLTATSAIVGAPKAGAGGAVYGFDLLEGSAFRDLPPVCAPGVTLVTFTAIDAAGNTATTTKWPTARRRR